MIWRTVLPAFLKSKEGSIIVNRYRFQLLIQTLNLSLSLVIDSLVIEGFGGGTNTNLKRDDVLRNLSLLIHIYIHRIFTIRKMVLEGSNVQCKQSFLRFKSRHLWLVEFQFSTLFVSLSVKRRVSLSLGSFDSLSILHHYNCSLNNSLKKGITALYFALLHVIDAPNTYKRKHGEEFISNLKSYPGWKNTTML